MRSGQPSQKNASRPSGEISKIEPEFHIFPEGKEKVIYVYAKDLVANLEDSGRRKVICVTTDENESRYAFDKVHIDGPCTVTYSPDNPLPNTNGRGVAVMRTTSRVTGTSHLPLPEALRGHDPDPLGDTGMSYAVRVELALSHFSLYPNQPLTSTDYLPAATRPRKTKREHTC